MVRAALACHDVAVALGTPFISGKDSLNNEFRPVNRTRHAPRDVSADAEPISIPPSLLISALGQIDDVAHCVSMDLKEPGNLLYIVGETKNELGGSHFTMVEGLSGGDVPKVDPQLAKRTFAALHQGIHAGLIRACHDLSEGGLAVALAEMAFAGGLGARIDLAAVPRGLFQFSSDENGTVPFAPAFLLFSESNTRFLCEVRPAQADAFEAALFGLPHACIGDVNDSAKLEIFAAGDPVLSADLSALKAAWQKPLRW